MSTDKAVGHFRDLCREDLFFLLVWATGKTFIHANREIADWWVRRINEVEDGPSTGTLDIWSRATGKSTIITFGDTLQKILRDPDQRIAIFSYSNKEAMKFMREHKMNFESNQLLQTWFPDILYTNPKRQAPKWSEDGGLFLKRKTTAREATLDAIAGTGHGRAQ